MAGNLTLLANVDPVNDVEPIWRPGQPIDGAVRGLLPEEQTPENAHEWQRRHFYMVPNLIYDLGLRSPARDLYGYYARRAGAGLMRPITESAQTIARKLRLGKKTVLAARRELAARGLIELDVTKVHGGVGFMVTVQNIWPFVAEIHRAYEEEVRLRREGSHAAKMGRRRPNR